jgi:uncharacterized protein (DUF1684 family)
MAGFLGCRNGPPDSHDPTYTAEIAAARAQKDRAFKSANSPVPEARRNELLPLAYFPIDLSYRVPAALKVSGDSATISMTTSNGSQRQMRRAGALEFFLQGQSLKLTALVESTAGGADRLFVPFADLTTGAETYSSGRYLDLDRTATGIYILDFNRAYHPDCYYGDLTADCPYPPPESRLKIPIRAGERLKEPNK